MAIADAAARPLLVIAGPTASGKSALALETASVCNGVIINADSMQMYRELRILTARPSEADALRIPHRLYGVLAAADACSAGRWRSLAAASIAYAWAVGQLPIVVGGSGLYLRALLQGLAPVPPVPPDMRAQAIAVYEQLGGEGFRAELARLDPVGAARVPAADRQRLIRAYEVLRATGTPLHVWQREPAHPRINARIRTALLMPPRDVLYRAIDARFDAMIARGALDEVARTLHLPADLPAMKAVGLRPLRAYLKGELSLVQACADAKTESRRYAKRQITWLRHQLAADILFDRQYSESLSDDLFSFIPRSLLTEPA